MYARIFLLAMLCVASTAIVVQSQILGLFEEPNKQGASYFVTIKRCVNLNVWAGRASSVDTQDFCVRLYTEKSCKGKSDDILPGTSGTSGHNNLADVDFDKKAYSAGACY